MPKEIDMTRPNKQAQPAEDAFTRGWKAALKAWAPSVRITSAVFKLTNGGEKPARLTEIALAAGYPPERTAALIGQIFSRTARTTDGLIYLEMPTTRESSSRFELRIGDRTLYTAGCAPDQFWIALFTGEPVELRTLLQAGPPVKVIVTSAGVKFVEPTEAVVGLINPIAIQAVDRIEEFDQSVCIYQTFYASAAAGALWKRQHPRGRLLTVEDFFDFWRQLLTPIVGDLMVVGQRSSSIGWRSA